MIGSSRDHQLLLVLAEELHFGRAAERLGTAQPHLSARLKGLEQSLGVVLFQRRPQVALTPAGEIIATAVRSAGAELQTSIARARAVAAGEVGAVTVGLASTVMATNLPLALQAFLTAHRTVNLQLREMHSAHQALALQTGTIDVALTRQPDPRPGVRCVKLLRETFVAALPEGHPLASGEVAPLGALADEPFVLFRRDVAPTLHDQILAVCAGAGFTPRVVQEAEEWQTVLGLVRTGFGVSLPPAGLQALQWPGLVYRPLVESPVEAGIYLCWDVNRVSPSASVFVSFLQRAACENKPAA